MKDQAIAKIKAEMTASAKNNTLQLVRKLLIKRLEARPSDAEAVLREGKTIAKACDEMRDEARKRCGGGNSACLSDDEGMEIVYGYFGMDPEAGPETQAAAAEPAVPGFDVDLDTLLGL